MQVVTRIYKQALPCSLGEWVEGLALHIQGRKTYSTGSTHRTLGRDLSSHTSSPSLFLKLDGLLDVMGSARPIEVPSY